MTTVEQVVAAVIADPVWSEMIPHRADGDSGQIPCAGWERKGDSHYKNGQFTRK